MNKSRHRYNIRKDNAIILASGGTLGIIWHLKKLDELKNCSEVSLEETSFINGTSAGAVAGLIYASDLDLQETITQLVKFEFDRRRSKDENKFPNMKKKSLLANDIIKKSLKNKKFNIQPIVLSFLGEGREDIEAYRELLEENIRDSWPSVDLNISVYDRETSKRLIKNKDNCKSGIDSALMSCKFPGLFKLEGRYIDGGISKSYEPKNILKPHIKKIVVLHPLVNLHRLNYNNIYTFLVSIYGKILKIKFKYIRILAMLLKKEFLLIAPSKKEYNALISGGFMDIVKVDEIIKKSSNYSY